MSLCIKKYHCPICGVECPLYGLVGNNSGLTITIKCESCDTEIQLKLTSILIENTYEFIKIENKKFDSNRCFCMIGDNKQRQCSRKNGHGILGLYCKQHSKKYKSISQTIKIKY